MRIALACLVLTVAAGALDGQVKEGLRIPGLTYRLDVRSAVDNPDRFGIDFDVTYETEHNTEDPRGLHYGLRLETRGFQTFDSDLPDLNSMLAQVGLVGYYYHVSDHARIPPEMVVRYLTLSNVDPDSLKAGQIGELGAIQARITDQSWYMTFDVHYRYETNHDLTTDDHAFGIVATTEVPLVASLLDVIPALTRDTAFSTFRVQPVRASIGIDRVTGADETFVGVLGGEGTYWRARFEAAWATRVLQGFTLRMTVEGHYILDANGALKSSGREFNSLFQSWFLYPLSSKTNLMVKYVSGRLPPDYVLASAGKLGLTLLLQ